MGGARRTGARRRSVPAGARRRSGALSAVLRASGALALVGLIALCIVAAAVVETRPRVVADRPADGAAAGRALDVYRSARAALIEGEASTWRVSETEINDAFAAAARMRPGAAGRAQVEAEAVFVQASLPLAGTRLWLNAEAGLAAREGAPSLTDVRVGRLPLPPWFAEATARLALDVILGAGAGRSLFGTVEAVRTDPPAVTLVLAPPDADRRAIGAQVRQALRDRAGAEDEERMQAYLEALRRARADGLLPERGSVVHHLQVILRRAAAEAEGRTADQAAAELRAGLFAFALTCGDRRFALVIGMQSSRGENSCAGGRLLERTDLRRHFAVSAGLAAATTLGEAHGIGELKELFDSFGGSGFSFDDMAANLAGARFATEVLAGEPERWTRIAAALDDERAIMPSISDLPAHLTDDEFRRRFGDVESAEYRAMLREIERRIASLPLYWPGSG
jgi:hypothetical protein